VSHFMSCVWLQVSRKCPWRFHAIFKSEQPVPVQQSGRAFEGVRMPSNVQQIMLKTSRRQSNTVRTLGQSFFNTELIFKSRHCLGSHPDVDLIKIELRCFWKDITEIRLNVAKLLSWRSTVRVRFSADLGFL